jgi:hypothetical protein
MRDNGRNGRLVNTKSSIKEIHIAHRAAIGKTALITLIAAGKKKQPRN